MANVFHAKIKRRKQKIGVSNASKNKETERQCNYTDERK